MGWGLAGRRSWCGARPGSASRRSWTRRSAPPTHAPCRCCGRPACCLRPTCRSRACTSCCNLGSRSSARCPHRSALRSRPRSGCPRRPPPDLFLIALATLNLLADVAERAPLLLVVEDAHWLDRSTSQVLAFVARRLSQERILLLLAIRDGTDSVFDTAGLDQLRVDPLDDESAAELLDSHAPDLVPSVRERLLRDAAGNPLALIELPDVVETGGRTTLPDHLPLTARLETAFAARLPELPPPARRVLLVAAADGGMSLPDVLDAAAAIEGRPVDADALGLAVSARLAQVEDEPACASATRSSAARCTSRRAPANAGRCTPRSRRCWRPSRRGRRGTGQRRPPAGMRPSRSSSTRWPTTPGAAGRSHPRSRPRARGAAQR